MLFRRQWGFNPKLLGRQWGTTLRLLDCQSKYPQAGLVHWLSSGENKREHLVLRTL